MTVADTAPPPGVVQSVRVMAADIKLAHSVFALPFALLGAFMAARPVGTAVDWGRLGGQLGLIVLAMVFARTCAMLANRILDRHIDARNPRTVDRALPTGRLPLAHAMAALLASAALFYLLCLTFGWAYGNWWPAWLGLPVLLWICAYGYFKRLTAMCHLYLGSALAISPVAAALAVNPEAVTSQPALWLLAGMVVCWVAGFDVVYALQDVEIDQRDGLHSLPGRLGSRRALCVSRLLHGLAAIGLAAIVFLDTRFGLLFGLGVVAVTGLLIYEHLTVSRWGTTRLALAFFTLNGIISCLLGAIGIISVLLA